MINIRKLSGKPKARTGCWEINNASFPILIKSHGEKLELLLKNSKNIKKNREVIRITGSQLLANPKLKGLMQGRLAEIEDPANAIFEYYDLKDDKEMKEIANYEESLLGFIINIDMDAVIKKEEVLEEIQQEKESAESLGVEIDEEALTSLNEVLSKFGEKEEISLWEFYKIKKDDYYSVMKMLTEKGKGDYDDSIIRDYEDILDLSCQIEAIKTGQHKQAVMEQRLSLVGDLNRVVDLANEKVDDKKVKDDIKEKVKKVAKNGGRKK